jgi:group I intron endonuclease
MVKYTYIYGLVNPITNNIFYIGKSDNPRKRLSQHINESRLNNKALKKGNYIRNLIENNIIPVCTILEKVSFTEWKNKEVYYISLYSDLTNDAPGGGAYPDVWGGRKHTEETKRKMSENNKGKVFSEETIMRMSISAKKRGANFPSRKGIPPHNIRQVYQYDLSGNYLNNYKSATETGILLNICQSDITRCCNGIVNRAHEFIFSYELHENGIKPFNYIHNVAVDCCDKSGKFIRRYKSIREAQREVGIKSGIVAVLKGYKNKLGSVQKTAGGYIWKYSDIQ